MADKPVPRNVLAIGAHPDDIELGAGGTIAQHAAIGDNVTMLVMTGGELGTPDSGDRVVEARKAATILGADIIFGPFTDGHVPLTSQTVNVVEQALTERNIDTVYVHALADAHQDHMLVSRATIAASRRLRRVMFYQSPSTTEFNPTVFVDIEDHMTKKLDALACHHSQLEHSPTLDLGVTEAAAIYWGNRGRLTKAEGFEPYRFVWTIAPRMKNEPQPWDGVERRRPPATSSTCTTPQRQASS